MSAADETTTQSTEAIEDSKPALLKELEAAVEEAREEEPELTEQIDECATLLRRAQKQLNRRSQVAFAQRRAQQLRAAKAVENLNAVRQQLEAAPEEGEERTAAEATAQAAVDEAIQILAQIHSSNPNQFFRQISNKPDAETQASDGAADGDAEA